MDELGKPTPDEADASSAPQSQSKYEKAIFKEGELSDGEIKELLERINTPATTADYATPGTVEVKTDSYHYDFTFELPGESDTNLHEYINWLNLESRYGRAAVPDPVDVFFPERWRVLSTFSAHMKKDTEILQLSDLLPDNLQIYFYPSDEFVNASYHHEQKMIIMLGGDMASPISLASLLHEIGHAWDAVNVKSGQAKRIQDGKNSDLTEKLRKERVANAFALKSIRGFIKGDPQLKNDLHKFLKGYALQSYHLGIADDIERREEMSVVAQEMAKDYDMDNFESEMEQQAMLEEFFQWKQTEEYEEWKQLDKYKDADEYDEFGLWREWCEQEGRAWWKVTE